MSTVNQRNNLFINLRPMFRLKWSYSEIIFGFSSIKRHHVDKNAIFQCFLGFSGPLLIIMQNDILLLHMLKIKAEFFELQVLQQFATTQNQMCKLQMTV